MGDALNGTQNGPRIRLVEALWDHVTDDPEELSFEAGERLVVVDAADADWWYATYLDQVWRLGLNYSPFVGSMTYPVTYPVTYPETYPETYPVTYPATFL